MIFVVGTEEGGFVLTVLEACVAEELGFAELEAPEEGKIILVVVHVWVDGSCVEGLVLALLCGGLEDGFELEEGELEG